jgi:hypothetical protein
MGGVMGTASSCAHSKSDLRFSVEISKRLLTSGSGDAAASA